MICWEFFLILRKDYPPEKPKEILDINIPEQFDARINWPNCTTIGEIRDQGHCGDCWAFGAVETMSDRECIHSNDIFRFSAEDLVSCCKECGSCNGGHSIRAWKYWVTNGIVSGGPIGDKHCCRPYTIEPNKKAWEETISQWAKKKIPTPKCVKSCQSSYGKSYKDDLKYGAKAYKVSSEVKDIQIEILKNGPVEGDLLVHPSFHHYKSGVYHHHHHHHHHNHHHKRPRHNATKILGWGVEKETPYWIVANSWGTKWGENGFFKILRGSNECNIESKILSGIPK